jgi:hypothetical protein
MAWYNTVVAVAKAAVTGFVEGAKAGWKIGGGAFPFTALGGAIYAAAKTAMEGESGLKEAVSNMQEYARTAVLNVKSEDILSTEQAKNQMSTLIDLNQPGGEKIADQAMDHLDQEIKERTKNEKERREGLSNPPLTKMTPNHETQQQIINDFIMDKVKEGAAVLTVQQAAPEPSATRCRCTAGLYTETRPENHLC